MLEKVVQYYIRNGIFLEFIYDTHSSLTCLIYNVGQSVEFAFFDQIGGLFTHGLRIYLIRHFGNNDIITVIDLLKVCFSTYNHASASSLKGLTHSIIAIDDSSCREIRCLDILHEFINGNILIVKISNSTIYYLSKIVRRHIGSHTYGNP